MGTNGTGSTRVVAVGGSAGSIEALGHLFGEIPPHVDAAFVVVVHVSAATPSMLPAILERQAALPARHVVDGDVPERSTIYVAPPDYHVLLRDGQLRLSHGPKENRHRPAINPLMRSLAAALGPLGLGVVLSGALDDGAAGLFAVKETGGVTFVQSPDEARVPSMPLAAIAAAAPDGILPAREIGRKLAEILAAPPPPVDVASGEGSGSIDSVEVGSTEHAQQGEPSAYTCPDCGGTLWESGAGGTLVLRCRVGHAYSEGSYLSAHAENLENALWGALRALEERISFTHRLADRMRGAGNERSATIYVRRADEMMRQARLLRDTLEQHSFDLDVPASA
jgi:two-component system chemotaxis response regulator CheB